jgi:Tfp pilus assembly protein PilN
MAMINLLPAEDQRQLAAARSNTLLLRYTILLSVFVIMLVIEILAVYVVVNIGKAQNEKTISENNSKAAGYASIKQQADTFKTNLATAKYILDKQVPYTTLMLALSQSLPSGSVIDKIAIDPATFGTPSTLSVKTTSYDKAIAVKTSLQNAKVGDTALFTSVSFDSVSSGDGQTKYPFTAIYNVTYSKAALAQ